MVRTFATVVSSRELKIPQDYEHGDYPSVERPSSLPPEPLDTEFKRKYPPDPLGKEMDDNARVWKVYRDEATVHDTALLDGWNKTLDILLIFAGLFSAVATAFIIESYTLLQPDNNAYMAAALYIIAITSNSSAVGILPAPPAVQAAPSNSSRWVNGLWFTSVFLSLSVALLCILVKQWLGEYVARMTASAKNPRHWARRRAFYSQGLRDWPVQAFISALPLLLHLALFLFFAGAGVWLWSLDVFLSVWLSALGTFLWVFYMVSTAVPFWSPTSPTATPLVAQMRPVWDALRICILRAVVASLAAVQRSELALHRCLHRLRLHARVDQEQEWYKIHWHYRTHSFFVSAFQDRIYKISSRRAESPIENHLLFQPDALDAAALRWLILNVPDRNATAVGLQALGAVPTRSNLARCMRTWDVVRMARFENTVTNASGPMGPTEFTRILRALAWARKGCGLWLFRDVPDTARLHLRTRDHPDLRLVSLFLQPSLASNLLIEHDLIASGSPTLTSTALILMHCSVDRQEALGLLLCMQLDAVTPEEWLYIVRILRPLKLIPCRRNPLEAHVCALQCVPELLSGVINHHRVLNVRSTVVQAAVQVLARTIALSPWKSGTHLSDLPSFRTFIASDLFVQHTIKGSVPWKAASFTGLLNVPNTWMPEDATGVLTVCRAVRNLMFVVQGTADSSHGNVCDDDERGLRLAFHDVFAAILRIDKRHTSPPSDHTADPSGTDSFAPEVHPSAFPTPRDQIDPLWMASAILATEGTQTNTSVLRMFAGSSQPFLELCDALAITLCSSARQGRDMAALVEPFLASQELASLLHWGADGRDARAGAHYARLVQHCVELRPSWWNELRQRVDNTDENLAAFIADIHCRLALLGPCTECPGEPPLPEANPRCRRSTVLFDLLTCRPDCALPG